MLEATLAAARKDGQTVTSDGASVRRITHGVTFREVPTHIDERGSLSEMFDPRWGWHADPLVYAYTFTIRPGYVKGWNLHEHHEDRYFVLAGEMELVLFDPRPDSPTCGEVCTIALGPHKRGIVNVPRNVWHADRNIGATDVVVVNFPTQPYEHGNPDKFRLPIDTDLIPHGFPGAKGY